MPELLNCSSGQSSNDLDIKWLCVDIRNFEIIYVYKPLPSQMTPMSIPMFSHPCLYAGDVNCQHTNYGYTNTNEDGSCLATWAAGGNLSLLYNPIPSKPVNRWNFRKADRKQYSRITGQLSSDLPSPDTTKVDEAYQKFCRAMFSATKETIPRGHRRNYTPCWGEECESLYKDFTSAPDGPKSRRTASALLQKLDEEDGTGLFNPLTLPTLVEEHGPLLTTLLATPDTLLANALISANVIAPQLIRNEKYETRDHETT